MMISLYKNSSRIRVAAAAFALSLTMTVPAMAETAVVGAAPGAQAAEETAAAAAAGPAAAETRAAETTAAETTAAAAETTAQVRPASAAETAAAAAGTTAAVQAAATAAETTAAAGTTAAAAGPSGTAASAAGKGEDAHEGGFWTGFNGGPGVAMQGGAGTASQSKYPVRNAAAKQDGYYFNDGSGMYTYQALESDLNALRSNYSGVSVNALCQTPDGRQVYHVIIGNQSAGKKLLVTGTMHAREYITSKVVMRQLKKLLDEKKGGDTSLDNVCVHFVPMMDPDGVAISQYGTDGMQTSVMRDTVKNIMKSWAEWEILTNQDKYNWYLNKWKNTAKGVDINQNFPTDTWSTLNDARNKPSSDMYKGPSAGSEAETRAMMELVNRYGFTAAVNYHAQGEIIYADDDKASEAVRNRCNAMGAIVQGVTGYRLPEPHEGSFDDGAFKSWLNVNKGIPAVTVEVGIGTCPLPEADIAGIWEKNKGVLNAVIADMMNW